MRIADRLRAIGVSEERIARFTDPAPSVANVVTTAARMADPQVQADLAAWRSYRDEPDAFRKMRLRIEQHEAIERGRAIEEMK